MSEDEQREIARRLREGPVTPDLLRSAADAIEDLLTLVDALHYDLKEAT